MFLIIDIFAKNKHEIITHKIRIPTRCSPDPFPGCKRFYPVLLMPANMYITEMSSCFLHENIQKSAFGQVDARTSKAHTTQYIETYQMSIIRNTEHVYDNNSGGIDKKDLVNTSTQNRSLHVEPGSQGTYLRKRESVPYG